MTSDPESSLFDFAASNRVPTNEEEQTVTDIHAALGFSTPPIRLMHPPVQKPSRAWRQYAFAAATIALVFAVATAGYFAINNNSTTPPPTEVPEVVLGLAGQESTAVASTTCEVGASIPIIQGVEASPVNGTALLHTPGGDLILDCAGEQEILASGIEQVQPQSWPGIVTTWDGETLTYLNIFTGDSYVSEDLTQMNSQRNIGAIQARSTNQLIIVPATGSPSDAAILDLATLTEEQLLDSNNNAIPLANIPAATSNLQGDCMVVAYSTHNSRMNSDYLGGFIVFDSHDGLRTVEILNPQMPVPREIATSPNCDQIASASFQGQQMEGTTTLTIQDVDGSNTIELPMETGDMLTKMLWLTSGDGIVFASGERLMLLEAPFNQSEPIALHEGVVIDDISLTHDSDIVTATGMMYGGGPDSVPQKTLIVDIASLDITEIEGYYLLRQRRLQPQEHNVLLVQNAQGQAFDAVSGEPLGQIESEIEFSSSFIQVPIDQLSSAKVGIIGTGPDDLWRILDSNGLPVFQRVEMPPGSNLLGHPMLNMSRDGWVFASQGWDAQTGWMMDMDDPESDWLEIAFTGDVNSIQFLTTEGLSSSSDATPKASPVSDATCDMSGDIPLFVGVNESPLDRTSVIVTLKQELKVVCEAKETVLATEVQIATPTQTPYVLLLMTQTGQMLLNVETGESLHIQQPPAQTQQTIGLQTWDGWALLPSTENPNGISLYLLDSFTEIPINVGEESVALDSVGGMAIGANDDVFALAITEGSEEESTTLTEIFIANLDGSSHVIQTSPIINPTQFVISPDGSTVAVVSFKGELSIGAKTISLLDAADGSLIQEIEIGSDPNFIDINWLNDGSALLYTNGTGLHLLSEPEGEPTTILEGDNVQGLVLTHNDNVVAIGHRKALDSGGFQPVTTILNLESGEQQELVGRDIWSGSSMATKRTTLLLTDQSPVPSSDPTVYTAVDAVTGETLGEIEHSQSGQGFTHSSWGFDRNINVIGFGPDSLWMLTDGNGDAALIQISEPQIVANEEQVPLQITVSPQGMTTLRTYTPNTAWILLPGEDEWIEVPLPDPTESQGVNANIGIIIGADE